MAEEGKIKINKFDGHDFGFWKMQIEDYLYQKKLHEPLAKAKPIGMQAEDWTLLDRQTLGTVKLSLAKNIAYNVVNKTTTYILFNALFNMYEKPNHVNEFNSMMKYKLYCYSLHFTRAGQALLQQKTSGKYSSSLLSEENKGRAESKTEGISRIGVDRNQRREDKEVHMAVRDYDDTLVCCVKNTVEDRIIDSCASFHATFYKEELEKFRLYSGKVRLEDDKTLDIAGVGDVVLKTSFGYYVGFRDQQWKVTKGSLVVAHGNKRGSLYMDEIPSNGINAAIDGGSCYYVTFTDDSSRKDWVIFLKNDLRINRPLNERAKSMRLHAGLPKMFWEDSVSTAACLINRGPSVPLWFRILKEECQGKEASLAHLRVFGCDSYVKVKDVARDKLDAKSMKCTFIGYGSDEMGYRFWNSKGHKVVRSIDVTFNEDSLYGVDDIK
ncbi:retrovirus-related pol polyprotein from transposon TNT 1-94 [Tanacetum coccineum]